MSAEAFKQQLAVLSAEYRTALPQRLARLADLRAALHGQDQASALNEMLRELHSLAGSAKTFGLAGLGEQARAAELFLDPFCRDGALFPENFARLDQLLEAVGRNAA